jgi:leucyl/phenylalanyl-tRNA---protein transferase
MHLTPDLLLRAYALGIFPMAESADDPLVFWVEPKKRGIIPLDGFALSKRLARTLRTTGFEIKINQNMEGVLEGCASGGADLERTSTWINSTIHALILELFSLGFAHTVEVYDDDALVGGLYGVALGGAFFGESMFHTKTDASKIALAHLVARLKTCGFQLLDTQFITPHLLQFGAVEIRRAAYLKKLQAAQLVSADFLNVPADFHRNPSDIVRLLQSSN